MTLDKGENRVTLGKCKADENFPAANGSAFLEWVVRRVTQR